MSGCSHLLTGVPMEPPGGLTAGGPKNQKIRWNTTADVQLSFEYVVGAVHNERATLQWETDFLRWPREVPKQMALWTWRESSECDPVHAALPMLTEYYSGWLIRGVPPELI